jgi:hypothetical protein
MLTERIELLIKRSTNAIDNNKLLVHKCSAIERERDALRTLIAAEKQRTSDMQTMLHSGRISAATASADKSTDISTAPETNE